MNTESAAIEHLFPRTCPVFSVEPKVEFISSSLLIQTENRHFLVSASHALRQQDILLAYASKNGTLKSLRGNRYTIGVSGTGEPGAATDKVDISAFDISDYSADFAEEFEFTNTAEIIDSPDLNGFAWCIGFPVSRAKNNPVTKQIKLQGFTYGTAIQPVQPPYDSRINFAIPYKPKRTADLNTGQPLHYYQPKGLSGSGAWLKDQDQFKLAGICVEYNQRDGTLIYTKARFLLFMLNQLK